MFKNCPLQFSLAAVVLAASQAAPAATAGHVDFATPGVSAVAANGQSRSLSKGSELQTGETIDTGEGRAQLRFSDGGMISLQPQTRFSLESYGYDKDDSSKNSVIMKLFKGGLRSITGLIGKTNRQGYKLQTATATVGIRGTEFSVNQFADGSILFHCADGVIDVTNQAGSAVISGGQSARVTSANSAPAKTDEKPFLPPGSATPGIGLPNNPIQDAQATLALAPLSGTFEGQWRTGSQGSTFAPGSGGLMPPTFTIGADGLKSFTDISGNITSIGAATAIVDGNDGVMAWGRWIGGPTTGNGFNSGASFPSPDTYLHYVVGLPAANVPTAGTFTYNMYGGTVASCNTGGGICGGSITLKSSLSVNFSGALPSGTFTMNMTNSGDGAVFAGGGGLTFSNNTNFNSSLGTMTSSNGFGTANVSLAGFLANTGATHAGVAYGIGYGTTTIGGTAVYRR